MMRLSELITETVITALDNQNFIQNCGCPAPALGFWRPYANRNLTALSMTNAD